MKRFQIFYYIELSGEGGHRLIIAETKDKAIEIFKKKIADEGNGDPKIKEIMEI